MSIVELLQQQHLQQHLLDAVFMAFILTSMAVMLGLTAWSWGNGKAKKELQSIIDAQEAQIAVIMKHWKEECTQQQVK